MRLYLFVSTKDWAFAALGSTKFHPHMLQFRPVTAIREAYNETLTHKTVVFEMGFEDELQE